LWRYPLSRNGDKAIIVGEPQLLDAREGFLVTDAKGTPPHAALFGAKARTFSVVPIAGGAPLDLQVQSRPGSAHLSPDGQLLATDDWEAESKDESDARVWNARTGELVRRLGTGANNSVRFSASGNLLIACGNGVGAGLWRLPEVTRVEQFAPRGEDAWFVPGDRLLGALEDGQLELVRLSDGALLGAFPGDTSLSVAFSPDGSKMYFGTSSRFLEWDMPELRRELRAIGLDWQD
jgi:WD40 repeat protein